ncbi:class I SAM-dependent methyltransferase [Thiorhodococcus mannitoliphagus]|nr:class I SAM-dependent methyltransferase [Thiorhodococcus mannitoliphagus]
MSYYESSHVETDTRLYSERANWIELVIPRRQSRIIDIGCGNGMLLRDLRCRGYSQLTGMDPSAKCVEFLLVEDIDAVQGSFFTHTDMKNFDCAILSGVLEHICDVSKMIDAIKVLIKTDGLLLVCVPDSARYYIYDNVPFDYFNIEHINHFDETSLLNLGLLHGMSIRNLQKTDIHIGTSMQPVIFCAYVNDDRPQTDWVQYSRERIRDYVARTSSRTATNQLIDDLVSSGEEIVIWGAGNYSSRLLATTALAQCRIAFWVDSDRHKQGTEILGRPVREPEALMRHLGATVLVAVAVYSEEIMAEISSMGLTGRIVSL